MSHLVTHKISVVSHQIPIRLDSYLTSQDLKLTRSQIQKLIEAGHILVNGKVSRVSQKVHAGDEIFIQIPPERPLQAQAENIPISILFEDQHLAVINKPAELVVHASAGHASGTLVNALLYHLKKLSQVGGDLRPGIVHRLDKGTSGVMLIAKNNEIHFELARQFHDRKVQKTYLALAYGRFKKNEGEIQSRLGRSRGDRKKISSKTRNGREAKTFYKILKQYENMAFVEVKPYTGRTHQIRVHLAEAGHPVVGDPLYGGKQWIQKLSPSLQEVVRKLDHQALHAWKLKFTHPVTKKEMEIEAALPPEFQKIFDLIDQKLILEPLQS